VKNCVLGLQEGRAEWQEAAHLSIELKSHLNFVIFDPSFSFVNGANVMSTPVTHT
jgi:hypothetical protein